MDTDNRELFEKDKIIEVLEAYFGKDRVFVVTTKEYDLTINPGSRNSVKSRSEWADLVVKQLYNADRGKLDDDDKTIQFSYIKLAQDENSKIYGLVNGKSLFHWKNPSDVWFYDLQDDGSNSNKNKVRSFCDQRGLEWYKDEIILVKNKDNHNSKEAYKNEGILRFLFHLFN